MKNIDTGNSSTLQNTHTRISQCALKLIKRDGYNKVTIPDICKAAGITKSSFYYHYSSKGDLIGDFIEELGDVVKDSYSQILLQDTYFKQIWEVFHIMFEGNIAAGTAIVKQVFISHLNMSKPFNFPHSAASWDIVVKLVKKSQEAGQIKNNNSPEDIAESAFELLRGVLVTWAIEDGKFDLEAISKRTLITLLMPSDGYDL